MPSGPSLTLPPTADRGSEPFEFDPFSQAAFADPFPLYEVLRDERPLYHNERRGFWALSRFEDVQSAARDKDALSNSHGVDLDATGKTQFGEGDFLETDPPEHDQLRDIVRRRFTPKAIAALEAFARANVERFLEQLAERDTVDLADEFAWRLPIALISELLGLPVEDARRLQHLFRGSMQRDLGTPEIPPSALEAADELREYFAASIAERRAHPRDDLLSQMANAEIEGVPLGDKAVGMAFLLFAAASDTTASLLSNALFLLARHPEQRAALIADPTVIPQAIEEILRYESPIQNMKRLALRDIELHGDVVPAGDTVLLLFGSANRDERRFPEADRLDITREIARHLGFGEGLHFCLGAPLARLEAKIALELFLPAFPSYDLAGPIERVKKQNIRGLAKLPVTLRGE
jgi:cytochrome P450